MGHDHHFNLRYGHLLGLKLRESSQRHPVLAVSVLVLLSVSLSLLVSRASYRQTCSRSTSEIEEKVAFRSTTVGFFFRPPVPACNSSSHEGGKKIKVVFASCVNLVLGSIIMRGIVIARLVPSSFHQCLLELCTENRIDYLSTEANPLMLLVVVNAVASSFVP